MITQNWTAEQGQSFHKLVVPRDRRTRRILKPRDAAGAVRTDAYGGLMPFTCVITSEGSIAIELTGEQLRDLAPGDYAYDIVATIPISFPYSEYETRKIAAGTLTVQAYTTITYGDEDVTTMELRFTKGEDFERPIVWEVDGVVQTVTGAYLQADSNGTAVVDLRWYATEPNDAAIIALPGAQKGFIVPGATGQTLVLRVDHRNTVPAGTYPFDLFVKDSVGDWVRLAKGSMIVQPATSENPTP